VQVIGCSPPTITLKHLNEVGGNTQVTVIVGMGAACCVAAVAQDQHDPSPRPPVRPPVSPLMVSDEDRSMPSSSNPLVNHHTAREIVNDTHHQHHISRPTAISTSDPSFGDVVPEHPATPNASVANPLRPPLLSHSNNEDMLQDGFGESSYGGRVGGSTAQEPMTGTSCDFLAAVASAVQEEDEFARTVVPPAAAADSNTLLTYRNNHSVVVPPSGGGGKKRKSSLVPPRKMSVLPPGSAFQSVVSRGNIPLADAVPNGDLTSSTSINSLTRAATRPVLLDTLRPNEFAPPLMDEETRRRQSVPLPVRSPRRRLTTMFTPDGSGDDVSFRRSHRGSTSTTATTSSLLSQNSGTHFIGGLWRPSTPQQLV
jgi:hypothetical protein